MNSTEALNTRETFTRAQVAWLMAQAFRWGYEHRADEVNGTYPPPPVRVLGKWYDQAARRQQADAEARRPRPNDFQPGQVVAPW